MIIGSALSRLFKDLSYEYKDSQGVTKSEAVQFHYGDHKELIKWLLISESENQPIFPLLWYVVNPFVENANSDWKEVNTRLIILHTFRDRQDNLNNVISTQTYDGVIEPIWNKVKNVLSSSEAVQVLGDTKNKYRIKDEPNYGVDTDGVRTSQSDFTQTKTQGDKSIATHIVDGRIIDLNLRIKTNCI